MYTDEREIPALLLTPPTSARLLGVCEKTLFNITDDGEIPWVQVRGAKRYAMTDLLAWIERNKKLKAGKKTTEPAGHCE